MYTRTELYGWGHKLVAEVCGIAEHIGVEIPPEGIFGKIPLETLGIQSVLTSQWFIIHDIVMDIIVII